jgi:hypothetical protein
MATTTLYPIIRNCNFESRDDRGGRAIDRARREAESGRCRDDAVIEALDGLEATLEEYAERQDMEAVEACRDAERGVVSAWDAIAD